MEHIAHAAILNRKNRCIIFGRDHDECVKRSIKTFGLIYDYPATDKGFLTDRMRFVSRHEALRIAIAVGQIKPSLSSKPLISDHFWSKKSGGKYIYDSVMGYIISACPENSSENKK